MGTERDVVDEAMKAAQREYDNRGDQDDEDYPEEWYEDAAEIFIESEANKQELIDLVIQNCDLSDLLETRRLDEAMEDELARAEAKGDPHGF